VTQKLQFLVVTIYEAEGLPAMDTTLLGRPDGLDGYVSIAFGANKAVETKVSEKWAYSFSRVKCNVFYDNPFIIVK
jgi:hypothetical protein